MRLEEMYHESKNIRGDSLDVEMAKEADFYELYFIEQSEKQAE